MTRLLINVEGATEEAFVAGILARHLYRLGYTQVAARKMGKQRERDRRGGIRPWPEARANILDILRNDPEVIVSTMVDYYGMPQHGEAAWPGRAGATAQLSYPNSIEQSVFGDVRNHLGNDAMRFIPFVMMHEFEALSFSDCEGFAQAIGRPDLTPTLQGIRDRFDTPEDINDSPYTAPSKRVEALIPGYRKPVQSIQAVTAIGLTAIRAECRHFRGWLEHLEGLANEEGT